MTLHIVRTDILLWALGGFGDGKAAFRDEEVHWHRRFSDDQVRAIRELAARVPAPGHRRLDYGIYQRIGTKTGIAAATLRVMVCRARKGDVPKYWKHITQGPYELQSRG